MVISTPTYIHVYTKGMTPLIITLKSMQGIETVATSVSDMSLVGHTLDTVH